MRRSTPLFVAAACAFGNPGCGQSHLPVPLDDLRTEAAHALCSHLAHCPELNDTLAAYAAHAPGGCPSVVARFAELDLFGPRIARAEAGTLTYDPFAARSCLDEIADCRTPLDGFGSRACAAMFSGERLPAEPCVDDSDCSGDARCIGTGTCGACDVRLPLGSECYLDADCTLASGPSRCSISPTSTDPGTCVAVHVSHGALLGAPCGRTTATGTTETWVTCAAELFCVGSTDASPGSCTAPAREGEVCNDDPCVGDTICEPSVPGGPSICHAITVQTAVGASCDDSSHVLCDVMLRLGCVAGTCQFMGDGSLGSVCGTAGAFDCLSGFYCTTDGACAALLPDGQPCGGADECLTGRCDTVCGGDASCRAP